MASIHRGSGTGEGTMYPRFFVEQQFEKCTILKRLEFVNCAQHNCKIQVVRLMKQKVSEISLAAFYGNLFVTYGYFQWQCLLLGAVS